MITTLEEARALVDLIVARAERRGDDVVDTLRVALAQTYADLGDDHIAAHRWVYEKDQTETAGSR